MLKGKIVNEGLMIMEDVLFDVEKSIIVWKIAVWDEEI